MKTNKWLDQISERVERVNKISEDYYDKYDIKQGLRNADGTGVVVGFTKIGSVHGYKIEEGKKVPMEGKLFYRNIEIEDLVDNLDEFGYEKTIYLLLLGKLPSEEELKEFNEILDRYRKLPTNFTENMILKSPSNNVMNKLQRSILALYSFDEDPDTLDTKKILYQSLKLIARFPTIISYGYHAKSHYFGNDSLYLHNPEKGIGTAKNILHMIRSDNNYSKLEADTLDLLLVLHERTQTWRS